jgi:hypothetical protein
LIAAKGAADRDSMQAIYGGCSYYTDVDRPNPMNIEFFGASDS